MSTSTSAARCSAGSVASAAQHQAGAARRRTAASAGSVGAGRRTASEPPRRRTSSRSSGSGSAAAHLGGPQPVEAGVDDDPVQPGGDRGVAAEGPGPAVRRDHAVLQAVGGVLGVAHGAQRDRPQPVAVPARTARRTRRGRRRRGPRAARRRWAPRGSGRSLMPGTATSATSPRKPPDTRGQRGQPDHEVAAGRRLVGVTRAAVRRRVPVATGVEAADAGGRARR